MEFKNIKRQIPHWIGWLIIVKGTVNLTFGIFSFFWATQPSMLNDINKLFLFWDFTPAKSLTGIIIGLGYFFLGKGLSQGKHFAWQIAIFWLSLNLADNLIPNVVVFQALYALIMIILLLLFRGHFVKKTKNPMRPQQLIACFSIVFAMAYGVIGCYLLRGQYQGINNWIDAIYYSMETYSTIGYGDIIPLTTNARVFTCSMIIIGVGSFVTAITILFGPAMEQRMKKVVNMVNKLNVPKDHVIIIGATTLGLYLAKTLQAREKAVIILDPNPSALKAAQDANFKVISSELPPEEVLETAGIKNAEAVLCVLDSDAKNLLATMVSNKLRADGKLKLKIITHIDQPQNIPYAKENGADDVISPAVIFGNQVLQTLTST